MRLDELRLGSRVRIDPDLKNTGGMVGSVVALNFPPDNDGDRRRYALLDVPNQDHLLAVKYRDLRKV